jgi:choline dehydrogenase-like flavoprotein
MTGHYDVAIGTGTGTGAGGGTLAHALAGTGKRILLLVRGDYVRRELALTVIANALRVGDHPTARL